MNEHYPYQPPETEESGTVSDDADDADDAHVQEIGVNAAAGVAPGVPTDNTVVPRYLAASLDNVLAMILGVVAAKSISEDLPIWQLFVLVAAYLVYFLLFEGLFSRTPGKLLTGLVVIRFNGESCTWRDTIIRTCFRVLEVNPILLGALPAAISIVFSRHHQRFGDRMARTVVVLSSRLPNR